MKMYKVIDRLESEHNLDDADLLALLNEPDDLLRDYLFSRARAVQEGVFGRGIYMRGLIELSNYCKNDCFYCGIRRSNQKAERYRLTEDEVLSCAAEGHRLGFRSFVIQGGEDPYFNDERMVDMIAKLRKNHPDSAITLSLGERSKSSYQKLFDAGADRYLLRHETADAAHYASLHPAELSLDSRKRCLWELREIGYQVGCGFMLGSPGQTREHILKDLRFIQAFKPHMAGIGPFIPHRDTPFAAYKTGSLSMTLTLLAIVRLMLPQLLLPATTALSSIDPQGRQKGILAGANVLMPNLSPPKVRGKYLLYNNKAYSGAEAAESLSILRDQLKEIGYQLLVSRGDYGEAVQTR